MFREAVPGCYVKVWEHGHFGGKSIVIPGPAQYPNMRLPEGDWGDDIDSLQVGPNAYVQCFEDENFEDTEIWFLPNQVVESLDELGFGDDIDSMRIHAQPPSADHASFRRYQEALLRQVNDVRAANPRDDSFRIAPNGNVAVSMDAMEDVMNLADQVGEADDAAPLDHPIFGRKHTYCCRMGHDSAPNQERQQFKAYSFQASLFCMRMARNKGWTTGSVSRGECKPPKEE
jgi:hypothetical protein